MFESRLHFGGMKYADILTSRHRYKSNKKSVNSC